MREADLDDVWDSISGAVIAIVIVGFIIIILVATLGQTESLEKVVVEERERIADAGTYLIVNYEGVLHYVGVDDREYLNIQIGDTIQVEVTGGPFVGENQLYYCYDE